eukprot:gnl/Dysnectes_brevis/690_a761_2746.p1 GENE.gnl/Dysnectes_brevis/690_a761_2746~~gnl/Dysnectes_brevis/690_a761_2746.p1  ORF type:complete len:516 (+),score=139.23 gnl/Dysnectes_brevis/690_a761_2746:1111-2658(+)
MKFSKELSSKCTNDGGPQISFLSRFNKSSFFHRTPLSLRAGVCCHSLMGPALSHPDGVDPAYPSHPSEGTTKLPPPTSPDDYEKICLLGRGTFAKVFLVKRKGTQQLYALKELKKSSIIELQEVSHTISERIILGELHHPFIVKLHAAFQTPDRLWFVLDYVSGGELFFHLKRNGCFSESQARLYTAEIILALEHLHSKQIVYRDLKPENVMIMANGHLKLTDFGLSKRNLTSTLGAHTFVGTAEYLAPELLQNRGHGKGVDFWALGTLIFEMITGLPPFFSRDKKDMYRRVLYDNLRCPSYMSDSCKDIIEGLLVRDPRRRLGSRKGGVEELKQHPWFRGLDWDRLYRRGYEMEYRPEVKGAMDLSNFDRVFTQQKPVDEPEDAPTTDPFHSFSALLPGPGLVVSPHMVADVGEGIGEGARHIAPEDDVEDIVAGPHTSKRPSGTDSQIIEVSSQLDDEGSEEDVVMEIGDEQHDPDDPSSQLSDSVSEDDASDPSQSFGSDSVSDNYSNSDSI